ncbi:hypothetical protein NUSPORA_01904 [Nucleospora cyclopteri]
MDYTIILFSKSKIFQVQIQTAMLINYRNQFIRLQMKSLNSARKNIQIKYHKDNSKEKKNVNITKTK